VASYEVRARRRRVSGWVGIGVGLALIATGLIVTLVTYSSVAKSGGTYVIAFGPVVVGFGALIGGVIKLLRIEDGLTRRPGDAGDHGKRNELSVGIGFRSFVAWRYLMARHHRVSRIVVFVLLLALFLGVGGMVVSLTLMTSKNPLKLSPEVFQPVSRGVFGITILGFVLLFLGLIVASLRYIFSFFTTVPLVGVWIGTGALICVLSVMSGFESDLRAKILGSNAHIQITRDDGEFTEWRETKDRIDHLPGVKASTPYAVSEVVIAASNNGMNVIIKGIDAQSVGKVTDLVSDLCLTSSCESEVKPADDATARKQLEQQLEIMKRLEPIVADPHDLRVPQKPHPTGDVVDPAPADMPTGGDPIDFSQPQAGSNGDGSGDSAATDDAPAGTVTHTGGSNDEPEGSDGSDGSDEYLVHAEPVTDPPPPDLLTTTAPPIDYSDAAAMIEQITADDFPADNPGLSRRTQSLPGILVGKELQKQTHLYAGEEVRVVSPLSDPSNPDATGTPIPFNRDYRVAGTFFTGMYEYDLKYVYVSLDSLQDFLDRGDAIDGIEVRLSSPDDSDAYVQRIGAMLGPHYRVQDWKELNRSLFSALKLEKIAMFLVLGIVILVASFSIVGNLIMVVVEKAREIALLKTLGASDARVMQIFAIQGLVIGLTGTVLGVLTGLAACELGQHFGIPLNPDVYYIDTMPVHVEASSVLITAAAGVLISMAATFHPALLAARVRPAAGMRH
jgi:lipoprotein-releasing system permease protein